MTKTSLDLPLVTIFIGRCWTKKYEMLAKQIALYVDSKYNSRVRIITRVKRPTSFVQVRPGYEHDP